MALSRFTLISLFLVLSAFLSGCNAGFGRSSNNNLASLSISANNANQALTPSFSSDETNYTRTVGNCIDVMTVTAEAEHESATMELQGQRIENNVARDVALTEGDNTIRIKVTAENERAKTYTIIVTKRAEDCSSDASISSLEITNGILVGDFTSEQEDYSIDVKLMQGGFRLLAVVHEDASSVEVDNVDIGFSGVAGVTNSYDYPVETSDGTVNITVTAGDGITTKSYEITLQDDSENVSGSIYRPSGIREFDNVGGSIALSDKFLILGAPGDSGNTAGAFYSCVRNSETECDDNNFVKVQAQNESGIVIEDVGDFFAKSIDLSGDFLVVGAPGETASGKAYIYRYTESDGWSMEKELRPESTSGDNDFGESVSIDGDVIVVGAPGEDAIYLYERSNGAWSNGVRFTNGVENSRFGNSVSVNDSSEYLEFAVGAPDESVSKNTSSLNAAGAVYIFNTTNDGEWSSDEFVKLTASNSGEENKFGTVVDLSFDTIAVGSPGEDCGGNSVVEVEDCSQTATARGAVYLFYRNGDAWDQDPYYLKPSENSANGADDNAQGFGSVLALSIGTLAVGFSWEQSDDLGTDVYFSEYSSEQSVRNANEIESGAVFLYVLTNDQSIKWKYKGIFKAPHASNPEKFGSSVDIYFNELAVGAIDENGIDGEVNVQATSGAGYVIK